MTIKSEWDGELFEEYMKAHGPPGRYRRADFEDTRRIAELERRMAALEAIILERRQPAA